MRKEEILTSDTKTPMTLSTFQPSLRLAEFRETVDRVPVIHSFLTFLEVQPLNEMCCVGVVFFTCEHVYKQSNLHLNQHCHFTNIIFININKHKY